MYIYYCPKCNGFDTFNEISGVYDCHTCKVPYLPLKVSIDDWNNMSDDEMVAVISKAKNTLIRKPAVSLDRVEKEPAPVNPSEPVEKKTEASAPVVKKAIVDDDKPIFKDEDSAKRPSLGDTPIFKDEEKLEDYQRGESSFKANPSPRTSRIAIISCVAGLVAITVFLIVASVVGKKNKYNEILAMEQSGDYETALQMCDEIPDYKDVSQIKTRIEDEKKKAEIKEIYDQLNRDIATADTADVAKLDSMLALSVQCQGQYDVKDIQQTLYEKIALAYYKVGDAKKAMEYFDKFDSSQYSEQKGNCETVEKLLGTWRVDYNHSAVGIGRKDRAEIIEIQPGSVVVSQYNILDTGKLSEKGAMGLGEQYNFSYTFDDVKNDGIEIIQSDIAGDISSEYPFNYRFSVVGNILHFDRAGTSYEDADGNLVKVTDTLEKTNDISSEVATKGGPQIGMTREEALSTEWGKPKKINTSTYAWGTSEQWVFDNYKYVYVDDGIVTSVQY